jgi:hypothetical protein
MNCFAALLTAPLLAAPLSRGTAMKSVVCRPVEEAKGKSGVELAEAIERFGEQFARANYLLTALLPGDPPIACFASRGDSSALPRGAK